MNCETGFCVVRKDITAQEKVNAEWDAMAGEWDDLAGGYAQGFLQLLIDKHILDSNKNSSSSLTILDFGCGTGLLTERLRSYASKIIAIDASSKMIEVLQDKIVSRDWREVDAMPVTLSNLSSSPHKGDIEAFFGTVDLIVASSVMKFIPKEDLPATMVCLGKLLKPGGTFVHTDWPKGNKHPDGMDQQEAAQLHTMASLQTMEIISEQVLGSTDETIVFFGIAEKP